VVLPRVGPAGAAAIVAAVAAVIVAIAGLLAARKVETARHEAPPLGALGIVERLMEIAKDRPMLSIGAALAAGVFALRNPTLLAALAKAFFDAKPPPQR
jgi:hypothetical protein